MAIFLLSFLSFLSSFFRLFFLCFGKELHQVMSLTQIHWFCFFFIHIYIYIYNIYLFKQNDKMPITKNSFLIFFYLSDSVSQQVSENNLPKMSKIHLGHEIPSPSSLREKNVGVALKIQSHYYFYFSSCAWWTLHVKTLENCFASVFTLLHLAWPSSGSLHQVFSRQALLPRPGLYAFQQLWKCVALTVCDFPLPELSSTNRHANLMGVPLV